MNSPGGKPILRHRFYLAQIASQQEQYEEAVQYYTRATESPGVPEWVQDW